MKKGKFLETKYLNTAYIQNCVIIRVENYILYILLYPVRRKYRV